MENILMSFEAAQTVRKKETLNGRSPDSGIL